LSDAKFEETDYRKLFEFTTNEKSDEVDDNDHNDDQAESKKKYNKFDFLDYFESKRFSSVFMTYRWMDYWPLFDMFA
jgi:hypothetical protein